MFTHDPQLPLGLAHPTARFIAEPGEADVAISVRWSDAKVPTGGETLFTAGALWHLNRFNEGYRFNIASSTFGAQPYKVASFNHDFTEGDVHLDSRFYGASDSIYPLEYPLDELLIMNLLARGRGAGVHGCGLIDSSGDGYLFIGQSGAGKSTTARLWQSSDSVQILSDDRIVIRPGLGHLLMCGTPWHGEADLASAAEAPLSRIFFLRHGSKNEIISLSKAEAVARLFACSFPPFYSSEALDFTLAFHENIANTVPCDELRFVPDASVVDFVREVARTSRPLERML